jgi:catechol 2,3-dioxygenase-like lactoylglutathione lyase family enzyme
MGAGQRSKAPRRRCGASACSGDRRRAREGHVASADDDLDDTLARLRKRGAQLVGEVVQYEGVYRLCFIRGPGGLLIGLAEQIG